MQNTLYEANQAKRQQQIAEDDDELHDHLVDGGDIPDEVWANWAYADDDDAEFDGRHGPWPGEK